MREIKFRKWHKDLEDMTFWDGVKGSNNLFWHTITEYPEMYHLMQFTGLKDKNGKEIFDGDLLKISDGNEYTICEVKWCSERGGWDCIRKEDGESMVLHYEFDVMTEGKIIGNIYEN